MPDAAPTSTIIRFGDFEVDLRAGCLRKCGLRVKLPTQCFQVLGILLQHAGEAVTREELRLRLWAEDVFVDFDANLNTVIARLREALNDSSGHPRFIETLPKRGYRFIPNLATAVAPRTGLVVLPFANLGGDPAQEYFADAITDEMISALASVAPDRLAVIARTTAMHYKGSQKDVSEIRRELGIDYVVEGSVHRARDRIRVSVQLIQARDQMHLWANSYDGDLHEVFGIESAAVQAIAAQTGISPRQAIRKPTEDILAYDLYIQGRRYLDAANPPEAFAKARQFFEQAAARDPEFALAYDSLAELYWYLGFFGFMPPKEALSTGVFHALRALEIDGALAETHALLAQYRKQVDFDWPEVRREMNLARKLNSASPVVRLRYAVTGLMPHGRIDEAICELEGALESDPMSRWVRVWLAAMLWFGRQYDRLIEQGQLLLQLDPTYYMGYFAIGVGCREKRMFDESVAAHRRASELSGGAPMMAGWLGLALAVSGNTAEARAVLARLHAIAPKAYVPPTSFAWIHLGLGETGDFFNWMNRAIDARDHMITPIKSYPFLDPVRSDPRYMDLLRRMNLKF
jgi:TolB-like protein/DNA-binding winged helix-turn-helix (wHTH) protein